MPIRIGASSARMGSVTAIYVSGERSLCLQYGIPDVARPIAEFGRRIS